MDKYTEFKDTLDKKYIEPTGVMKSEGVISLGDLISLLEKGFDELKVVMDGSNLKSQINGDRTFMQRFGLFKMKSEVLLIMNVLLFFLVLIMISVKSLLVLLIEVELVLNLLFL